jgi:hypothetical protein
VARRGFFSRLAGGIRSIFGTPREETRAAPSSRSQQREQERREEREFRQVWRDDGGHGSYSRHRDLFDAIPGIAESDHDEQIELWDSYIRNMINGTHRRNDVRNPFWSDVGIHPRDFDWDEWRDAQGYSRR